LFLSPIQRTSKRQRSIRGKFTPKNCIDIAEATGRDDLDDNGAPLVRRESKNQL
jgi:hypothetical protein